MHLQLPSFPIKPTFFITIISYNSTRSQLDEFIIMLSQSEQTQQSQIINTDKQQTFDGLTSRQIWAYGMGHFLNDLTAACWFNYLLFFLKTVVRTEAASIALLAGQLCDGIATPIVGFLSDRSETKLGKRTPWYIAGLIIIILCFIPVFRPFRSQIVYEEYIYYCFFPGWFNVGWACLQISHMSLVPSLTCSRKRRDQLNNFRNSFTFLANFVVLTLGLLTFWLMTSKQDEYKLISYLVVLIGSATSIFFLTQIKQKQLISICQQKKDKFKLKLAIKQQAKTNIQQPKQQNNQQSVDSQRYLKKNITQSTIDGNTKEITEDVVIAQPKQNISLKFWFTKPKFYLFGISYMCVRLNSNIFGTFLPFYLISILKLSNQNQSSTIPFSIALVPLIVYFSSSLISPKLTLLYSTIGRRKTLLLGTFLSSLSFIYLFFLQQQNKNQVYAIAVIIGLSQSMILSTGINLISDVIGNKSESGAFVFGIYSFLDKISAGLLIFYLANQPCFSKPSNELTSSDTTLIKMTVTVIPMTASLISAIIVFLFSISQYISHHSLSESKLQHDEFVHSVTLQ